MANPNQFNNEPQPLVQPQNTSPQFSGLASGFRIIRQVYDAITIPPQTPIDGSIPSRDSPSTPTFPGSFPRERSTSVESSRTAFGGAHLEEHGMPTATPRISGQVIDSLSQAREELGNQSKFCDRSERSATPHDLSRPGEPGTLPSSLRVPVIDSTSHATEELGRHDRSPDRSEGHVLPAASLNASHSPQFQAHIPSEPMTTAQFQGAYGVSISGNPNFTNIGVNNVHNYGGARGLLEHMENFVSFNALHDSSVQDPDRRCHPGTRSVVLKRIRDWIDNPSSVERIFWLHGPAGAGKSAIAQTIARSYGQEQVAATFFFYRADTTRNDGNRLFTTIAWQLALLIPSFRDHIARSLDQRPDLPRKDVETQFKELIVRPFQTLKDGSPHLSSLVIIIDGVDECTDEKLQRRFLKVIRNAIEDDQVPLRFLISSRPEAHIQEAIDRFPEPNLRIDLGSLDDSNHDIEKYLRDEFSRIASEQDLDSLSWPGDERIQKFVYKSSGQFAYASTVIRYIGDEYSSAIAQLDIILGLKPQSSKSPFAELDALYMEILERQPDQDFLITFLALLIARLSVKLHEYEDQEDDFHFDDAMLMNVSDLELRRKLRGMRSLFKFDPHIDLYHRSFLDFLQDPSRSLKFYTSEENAHKRYLELITSSIVRFASKVIDQPNYHELGHFRPRFHCTLRLYPPSIKLPVTVWELVLRPLVCLQDKLLTLPNFTSTWNLLPCDTCTVFHIMRDLLLHLTIMQGICSPVTPVTSFIQAAGMCLNNPDVSTNRPTEDDSAGDIQLLFVQLRKVKLEQPANSTTIKLLCSLLRFDYREIVKRVCSVADAQILMDLIDSVTNNEYFVSECGLDTVCKATCLGLEVYARVPVLPRPLFSNSNFCTGHYWRSREKINFGILCQAALLGRISDYKHVVPLLRIHDDDEDNTTDFWFVGTIANESKSLIKWRRTSMPTPVEIIQAMLGVAKVIQYLHSIGAVFASRIKSDDIFLDAKHHAKIRYLCTTSRYITETPSDYLLYSSEKDFCSYATNVFIFGCFFYEMYFHVELKNRWDCKNSKVSDRPSEPDIHEDAWQLIQRCCADDPAARPTMDQVVLEMESWNLA